MNAQTTSSTKAAPSAEDLHEQIENLREDLMKLAATIKGEMSKGVDRAEEQISKASRDARATTVNAVLDNPLTAVGIAAGIGFLVGMMTRKG